MKLFDTFYQTARQFVLIIVQFIIANSKTKKSPCGLFLMAETERFELSVQVTPHNTLAGCRLKPTRPRFQSDFLIIT